MQPACSRNQVYLNQSTGDLRDTRAEHHFVLSSMSLTQWEEATATVSHSRPKKQRGNPIQSEKGYHDFTIIVRDSNNQWWAQDRLSMVPLHPVGFSLNQFTPYQTSTSPWTCLTKWCVVTHQEASLSYQGIWLKQEGAVKPGSWALKADPQHSSLPWGQQCCDTEPDLTVHSHRPVSPHGINEATQSSPVIGYCTIQ